MSLHKKGDDERRGGKSAGAKNDGRRVQRVEKEIREVIASYLITGFRGQLQGLVSVSRVQITKDLRTGYVYISVLGSPGDADASLEELQENAYDVQHEISRKLKMKFCPKLKFFLDESMDSVIKVEKILRDIGGKNAGPDKKVVEPEHEHDDEDDVSDDEMSDDDE